MAPETRRSRLPSSRASTRAAQRRREPPPTGGIMKPTRGRRSPCPARQIGEYGFVRIEQGKCQAFTVRGKTNRVAVRRVALARGSAYNVGTSSVSCDVVWSLGLPTNKSVDSGVKTRGFRRPYWTQLIHEEI